MSKGEIGQSSSGNVPGFLGGGEGTQGALNSSGMLNTSNSSESRGAPRVFLAGFQCLHRSHRV